MGMIDKNGLKFDSELHDFIVNEAIPGTGVDPDAFFKSFAAIVTELAPKNRALLEKRDAFQAKLDDWYRKNGAPSDMAAYEAYLREIGYILPEGPEFQVATDNVDPEIAEVAGPQLVVPVSNARYALNAANARWGSLMMRSTARMRFGDRRRRKGQGYNPVRGGKVIAWARDFLDRSVPLAGESWSVRKASRSRTARFSSKRRTARQAPPIPTSLPVIAARPKPRQLWSSPATIST